MDIINMKKIIPIILLFLFVPIYALATTTNMSCYGDSIFYGSGDTNNGTKPCSLLMTDLGLSTYTNRAIAGTCLGDHDSWGNSALEQLSTFLSTDNPKEIYLNSGINDIGYCGTSLSAWLGYYATFLTAVTNAGSTLIPVQITPSSNTGPQNIKTRNAYLEDFAYTHTLKLGGVYQDMSDPTTDDIMNQSWCALTLCFHPNETGDIVYGYLISRASIPTQSRDWGHSGYPSITHDSFSWWAITGGSLVGGTADSVTGNIKGGALTLGSSDSAVSDVISILPNSNNISITVTGTGSPTIYYRTSTSNFTRTSGGSWTTYSTPFSLTAGTVAFVQIKLAGQSENTNVLLNWGIPTYTISGTVSGNLAGVTINLTGTSSASTTTASDGTYSFTGLSAGSYTITPSKTGYTFSPASLNPTVTSSNVTGQDFTASAVTNTISYFPCKK
jgi:hypothetical protein